MLKEAYKYINKKRMWGFFSILLGIIITEIVATALIPEWRKSFYDILQTKNEAAFPLALTFFFILMLGLGAVQGLKIWIGQLVSVEWRKAVTELFETHRKEKLPENPTQAYTESLRNSTEQYLQVGVEIFISSAIIVSLLWVNLNNTFIITSSLIYSVIIIAVTWLFKKPLILTDKEKQIADGKLREVLANNGNIKETFLQSLKAYYDYIRINMYFILFGRLKGALAAIIPMVFLSGAYFSGQLTLGQYMAESSTFELIVVNTTILVIMFPSLTTARASYNIVKQYYKELVK